ncbi:MAG: FMN-binding protein [Proteobacteria bacterium]|nr:FMN-binding protein [Pseudomonadota bacterium]
MSRKRVEQILALASICFLFAAWFAGGVRSKGEILEQIKNISSQIQGVTQIRPQVFEGYRRGNPSEKLYIGIAGHPSYGGLLQVAIVVNSNQTIERVALLQDTDTGTYITKVLGNGVLDAFLGHKTSQFPQVDAVSGATLTSTAMIKGVEKAAASIHGSFQPKEKDAFSKEEVVKAAATLGLFLTAVFISSRFFRWNKKYARLGLLGVSTVILGGLYGAQFSLSSFVLLLSGGWTKGLGSYTSLICLILALLFFFTTRKNLYCAMICPFGGVQEGLGRITRCSPPRKREWMKWSARLFTLFAMGMALYFRNASNATYEPFGMVFSFIGSDALFALTILILLASLFVRRPWCTLFCPVTCVFDFLAFVRSWVPFNREPWNEGRKKEVAS